MTSYAPYIAATIFAIGLLTSSSVLASSTLQEQESTIHSSSNNNMIVRQSSSSSVSASQVSNSSISNRIQSSSDNLQLDLELSGKIASSIVNTTSGAVEAVLFGNWNISSAGFAANFTQTPINGNDAVQYRLIDSQLHSIQEINDSLAMHGTIEIVSNNTSTTQVIPITIIIQEDTLVIGFGEDMDAIKPFEGIPIVGFAQ